LPTTGGLACIAGSAAFADFACTLLLLLLLVVHRARVKAGSSWACSTEHWTTLQVNKAVASSTLPCFARHTMWRTVHSAQLLS
jgi:hypothetical protein